MLKKVIVPTLGLDMEGATIQRWLKAEGEEVVKDEPILLVETDKAAMEINAPEAGVLRQILQQEGAFVPVTETVALVETAESDASPESIFVKPDGRKLVAATPDAGANTGAGAATGLSFVDVEAGGSAGPSPLPIPTGRGPIRASPAARRLARDLGVDLAQVKGTGPLGRVQGEDIQNFAQALGSISVRKPPNDACETFAPTFDLPGRLVPLSRKRKLTADRMALSSSVVARLTINLDVDATEMIHWRSRILPVLQESKGIRVTYNNLMVKVIATALREHPYLNSRWTDQGIYLVEPVNVGVAVAVEDGLVVVVVQDADKKSVDEISLDLSTLVARAREDRLSMADIAGGTFTITNLGMFGIDSFTPIVNPPEAAILGVGRISERGVGIGGQLVLRPMMTLSLSLDHRILDGAPAARFLQRVRQLLEDPYLLI